MRERRGPWYLVTGFVIGLAVGLFYAWVVSPVRYVDTPPSAIRAEFKDRFRALIAAAYAANRDLPRAQARLSYLSDDDSYRAVAVQAQQALAEGGSAAEARALGILAAALRQTPTPAPPVAAAPTTPAPTGPLASSITLTPTVGIDGTVTSAPTPSRTPFPTRRVLPSVTPTATPGAPFALESRELVCEDALDNPILAVEVLDAAGEPVPGVTLTVAWDENEEQFFTGFKPELGPGYADFVMTPGVIYSLQVAAAGAPVIDLVAEECAPLSGSGSWGAWQLVFVQPGDE